MMENEVSKGVHNLVLFIYNNIRNSSTISKIYSLKGEEEPIYVEITEAGVSINLALIVSLPNSLLAAQR
jgi:hypothetical protein